MLLRFLVMPSWRYLNNIIICLDNIPMCVFSSRTVVKWIRRTTQRFPLRMIGPHHELSRFEATWRSGDYFVYLLMWYKQTWSNANQTVIFFTIYFFLYLLIILNIDENTTSLFIGFRGGDFIDSVYVFDRLLVQ